METISLSKLHKQTKHDLTIPTYIEYEKKKKKKHHLTRQLQSVDNVCSV